MRFDGTATHNLPEVRFLMTSNRFFPARNMVRAISVLAWVVGCSMGGGGDRTLAAQSPSLGLTELEGIRVGHHTLSERPTGCTVVLAESGAVAGVDVH